MAETTVLTETRIYLAEHGINLSSLSSSQKDRSDNVIIAKNFPYGTTEHELVALFGGVEIVKRVLLPPAGTIAFIEFHDTGQARAAFKRLAYRRFKDVPLYLEKAPKGIFTAEPTSQVNAVEAKKGSKDILDEDVRDPGATLYVKNLDFATTQVGLAKAFSGFPGFRVAVLKTKPVNAKGERLSMGYGFVTFQSKELATATMNAGVVLDGRKLDIKFARQGPANEVIAESTKKSTAGRKKIVIKNLGFSVSKKDIRELFGCDLIFDMCLTVGRMDIFSHCGCPRSLIIPLVGLPLSNLLLPVMRAMRWSRWSIVIFWEDTWFSNGPKRMKVT
jgi:multiple RNA-binding domain-containing protein 1